MASAPISSWQIHGETMETVRDFILGAPKSLHTVTAPIKLKDAYSLKEKLWPVHGVAKSLTWLSDWTTTTLSAAGERERILWTMGNSKVFSTVLSHLVLTLKLHRPLQNNDPSVIRPTLLIGQLIHLLPKILTLNLYASWLQSFQPHLLLPLMDSGKRNFLQFFHLLHGCISFPWLHHKRPHIQKLEQYVFTTHSFL